MTEELFVPGRVCLFGEHSDWAGAYRASDPTIELGRCLIAGTDQGLTAVAERNDDALLFIDEEGRERRYRLGDAGLADLPRSREFHRHQIGVALAIRARFPSALGLTLHMVRQDLPRQKGLSSSAAACVLMARAYARVYDLPIGIDEEMDFAYRGERMTGSECGRMDQACAFGRAVTLLTFDGEEVAVARVRVGAPLHYVLVDLHAGKDTVRILADLNRCYRDRADGVATGVREALGPRNRAITEEARARIEAGDARGLGRLMTESQQLFDAFVAPACPGELTSPRLHAVLDAVREDPRLRDLAWGGKGVGSQGDGGAQLIARDADAQARLLQRLPDALGVTCYPLTLRQEPRA